MKNIKLWLDDIRDPASSAIKRIYGTDNSWIWVKNVGDAKKILLTDNVVLISFDNDLGQGLEEGYQLANWIEEQAHNGTLSRMIYQIHSSNPSGSEKIRMAMVGAEKFWDEIGKKNELV